MRLYRVFRKLKPILYENRINLRNLIIYEYSFGTNDDNIQQ